MTKVKVENSKGDILEVEVLSEKTINEHTGRKMLTEEIMALSMVF